MIIIIHDVRFKELINEQLSVMGIIIEQTMFEIDLLGEIIISARGGIFHSSLLSPRDMLEQLKEIKLKMSDNQKLLLAVELFEIYKLIKVSKINIAYYNETLMFVLMIPLVDQYDFTLYRLIPLPIFITKRESYLKIVPHMDYLAISKNLENYVKYYDSDLRHCQLTSEYLLCPSNQSIQNRLVNSPCEVKMLFSEEIPQNCKIKVLLTLENTFYKLKYQNTWIYIVDNEKVVIDCEREP